MASPSITKPAGRRARPEPDFDWRRIAYHTLVSRALDDARGGDQPQQGQTVPKEHLVLYQFSARGHDVAQTILAIVARRTRTTA